MEIYRIKNGVIKSGRFEFPFYFGIVYNDEGFIMIDVYMNEDYDINSLSKDENKEYWDLNYNLSCLTEDQNKLSIDNLRFTHLAYARSRVKMICRGKMEHFKNRSPHYEDDDFQPYLSYIVVEGLKIEFKDITEKIKARAGKKIEDFTDHKRDHTSTDLVYNRTPYSQTYFELPDSEDIAVQFTNEHSNQMTYELYLELKDNYVTALSFINGAEVRVRKEFHGIYHSVGKVDAENMVTYSFRNIKNLNQNGYLPVNNVFHRGERVLGKFLMLSFDKFVQWNKKLDLNSIIFYLNSSEQSKNLNERVFIKIIAFERLTTMYVEELGQKEEFLPANEDFVNIKQKLLQIIEDHKTEFGNAYHTVKGKISNLNQIKRHSTTDKMYRILNDFDINIDSKIEELINIVRHKTVHRGEIGEGKQAVIMYHLLDELIREIILRMIEYKGIRKSLVLLK